MTICTADIHRLLLMSSIVVAAHLDRHRVRLLVAELALAIVGLAGLREKMRYSDIPDGLRGLGITFIAAGFMSLAFLGVSGIAL